MVAPEGKRQGGLKTTTDDVERRDGGYGKRPQLAAGKKEIFI
uniref:Uncharacterized protein n=1 Tax=Arundo donax TaxID=35708 RepID=A0A0A9ARC6_ARUDO